MDVEQLVVDDSSLGKIEDAPSQKEQASKAAWGWQWPIFTRVVQ
jgi:hypothetical protein